MQQIIYDPIQAGGVGDASEYGIIHQPDNKNINCYCSLYADF